jgi:hypothetical protein
VLVRLVVGIHNELQCFLCTIDRLLGMGRPHEPCGVDTRALSPSLAGAITSPGDLWPSIKLSASAWLSAKRRWREDGHEPSRSSQDPR